MLSFVGLSCVLLSIMRKILIGKGKYMNEIIENRKKSEVLADKIATLNYGDVILHSQIAEAIGEAYKTNKYTSTIAKTRKILLKRGICLENIPGDGYRVVEPDNFVDQSLKHYKRGFNEMQKGHDTLEHAPTKNMTPEGLEVYRRVHDRAVILAASMKGTSIELKMLGEKKKHPMSPELVGRR